MVTPINFISLSISECKFVRAFSTPFCPPAAKAYKYSLPPEQAFALGQQAKQSGKNESYNPYRNMDSTKALVTELNAAWIDGWQS